MNIYLDTSFISRYSEDPTLLQDIAAERNLSIRLIVSSSHLIEALPKAEIDISRSIKRIEFLARKDICVPVVPFNKLFDLEIESSIQLKLQDIICPWEHLIIDRPSGTSDADFVCRMRSDFKKKIKTKLSEVKNRKQRELLKDRFLLHGEPRFENFKAELEETRSELLRETRTTFPELAVLYEQGGVFDVILNKTQSNEFSLRLWNVLMSPTVLAKLSLEEEYREDLKPVSHYFWMQHDRITKMVSDQVRLATELQANTDLSHKRVIQEMTSHLRSNAFYLDVMNGLNDKALDSTVNTALGTKKLYQYNCDYRNR